MPHQCVRCGVFYPDGSPEVIAGCSGCGRKLFFYVKNGKEELLSELKQPKLSTAQRLDIERDVHELGRRRDRNAPVVLEVESIRAAHPGQYELDLVHLFDDERPLVYRLEEGKYLIDIAATFDKRGR